MKTVTAALLLAFSLTACGGPELDQAALPAADATEQELGVSDAASIALDIFCRLPPEQQLELIGKGLNGAKRLVVFCKSFVKSSQPQSSLPQGSPP